MRSSNILKKITAAGLAAVMLFAAAACSPENDNDTAEKSSSMQEAEISSVSAKEETVESSIPAEVPEEPAGTAEKNGEVVILFTSDIHCGVEDGFTLAGLVQVRQSLENEGYTTILVDDGDAVQGGAIGSLTRGEAVIELMNEAGFDVAIPGNHEYDFGMEQFLHLAEMADFPYISCNFNREGELVFAPYIIMEAAGMKIAFVGVTTPKTITSSTPKYFQDENGQFIYGFLQDETGDAVYEAVQKAVNEARAEGADYVYVMGHLGNAAAFSPWTYDDVISHTNGIDVFLDGHSHDTDQVVMKNKDGENVVRSAVGTKLECIGYSFISPAKGIYNTGIWSWPNKESAAKLFGISNEITEKAAEMEGRMNEVLNQVVGYTDFVLTINDPEEKDASGNPVRMVRRAETNLGDFITDAFRSQGEADICIMGGGGMRKDIAKGDITYGEAVDIMPFGNYLVVIEATGQQILDALEWGARALPAEIGAFMQVSGLSYEVDVSIPSGCQADGSNMCTGIEGERRVKNVMVGNEPLDPEKTYTVASTEYNILDEGDGITFFNGDKVILDCVKADTHVIADYLAELGGTVPEEYADPYGQGRIVITGG